MEIWAEGRQALFFAAAASAFFAEAIGDSLGGLVTTFGMTKMSKSGEMGRKDDCEERWERKVNLEGTGQSV